MKASLAILSATVAVAVALVFAFGCDGDFVSAGPVTVCAEAGQQCQLEKGPLGVCERTACPEDRMDACFVCTSQH